MNKEDDKFKAGLENNHSHVKLLLHEELNIDGVNFFGRTMWNDSNGRDTRAMGTAPDQINDFRRIYKSDQAPFSPNAALAVHKNYVSKLLNWFEKDSIGPRLVISHNAPVINPQTKYKGTSFWPFQVSEYGGDD